MAPALIIFAKNPVLGMVKTRLADGVGNERALTIYRKLLHHTFLITRNILADKYVFYSDHVNHNDLWTNEVFKKELQSGSDLGERMKNAFRMIFKKGHKQVVIIGTDCYELTQQILQNAFDQLKQKDVVIGPAKDGGYYLLGMKVFNEQIFTDKSWSTSKVFQQTLKDIKLFNYSVCQLPILNDIDTATDVNFSY